MLFPALNLEQLKIQAEKLAGQNESIVCITLYHSKNTQYHGGKYILVFEMFGLENKITHGLNMAILKLPNDFYGEGFAEVYKDKQDCPWRISEEWTVELIGPGKELPKNVLANKFWLLYEASEDNHTEQIKILIKKAGSEVKNFYENLKTGLTTCLNGTEPKEFLEHAIKEIRSKNYFYIKESHFDINLFRFSTNQEWQYFKERVLKKIVDGANLGPITQKRCGEIYKKIFG